MERVTITLVWVDHPIPKEEGRQKSDGYSSESWTVRRVKYMIHNIVVYPQLQVMETFGELMTAALSEKLHCPMAANGRETYLRYHSKVE